MAKLDEQDQKVKEEEQSEKIDEKVMESDGKLNVDVFFTIGGILVILIIG